MIIHGNTAYQADEDGNIIEEPYKSDGCVWRDIGMCRGCPVCNHPMIPLFHKEESIRLLMEYDGWSYSGAEQIVDTLNDAGLSETIALDKAVRMYYRCLEENK